MKFSDLFFNIGKKNEFSKPRETHESPTRCKAPHIWQVLSAQGDIKPCCSYRGEVGHIRDGNVKTDEFHKLVSELSNGVKSAGCAECWHRESLGFNSHRLYGDDYDNLENEVQFLEFNLSNLCNLKCRMCNSDSSSAWIEDEKIIQQDPELNFRRRHGEDLVYAFPSDKDLISYLENQNLKNVKRLTFKGGEPLLHKQVFLITEFFKKNNQTDIFIQFTSSGTIFNSRLDLLRDFREVEFTFSIEAIGSCYQYIRGGSKHDLGDILSLLKFLKGIPNFSIISNSCIPAYSFFSLGELYVWLKLNIPDNREDFVSHQFVSVDQPAYLGVKAIPKEYREQALEKSVLDLKKNGMWTNVLEDQFSKILAVDQEHDEVLLEQFVKFTKKVDKIRSQDIAHAIPEYERLFKSRNNYWSVDT